MIFRHTVGFFPQQEIWTGVVPKSSILAQPLSGPPLGPAQMPYLSDFLLHLSDFRLYLSAVPVSVCFNCGCLV